jgi:hypothetical protein
MLITGILLVILTRRGQKKPLKTKSAAKKKYMVLNQKWYEHQSHIYNAN